MSHNGTANLRGEVECVARTAGALVEPTPFRQGPAAAGLL